MNNILESVKFVVDNSNTVKINSEKIGEFCKNFAPAQSSHWATEKPMELTGFNEDQKLNFLLVLNSLNFSYWNEKKWAVEYHEKKFDGAFGMIAAIKKATENNIPVLDTDWLSELQEKDFEKIVQSQERIPLFEERLAILKEIGTITKKKFKGKFSVLLKQSKDAEKLLYNIVSNYPSFEDYSIFLGKKILFYKRAQVLVSDIFQLFNGKGIGNLANMNQLTACADYKIPWVLKKIGILSYSSGLEKKIDSKTEILHDSQEEIEIRANTVWAVELIRRKLEEKMPDINSIKINYALWMLGQKKEPNDKPYHLTRTTKY